MKKFVKGAAKSKTLWFNAAAGGLLALEPVFGMLQAFIPGNVYAYMSVALVAGNVILRVITTQAIVEK